MTSPVAIVPRFEPQPFWHLSRKRLFVAAFWRPRDLCFGIQFMFGGLMFHLWPISVAIVDPLYKNYASQLAERASLKLAAFNLEKRG